MREAEEPKAWDETDRSEADGVEAREQVPLIRVIAAKLMPHFAVQSSARNVELHCNVVGCQSTKNKLRKKNNAYHGTPSTIPQKLFSLMLASPNRFFTAMLCCVGPPNLLSIGQHS